MSVSYHITDNTENYNMYKENIYIYIYNMYMYINVTWLQTEFFLKAYNLNYFQCGHSVKLCCYYIFLEINFRSEETQVHCYLRSRQSGMIYITYFVFCIKYKD